METMEETHQPAPESANEPPSAPRFATWQFIGLLVVVFLLGLGAGYFIWAYPLSAKVASLEADARNTQFAAMTQSNTATQTAATQAAQDAASVQIPQNVKRYNIPTDGSPAIGLPSAPITIIEFSDYECPFCRQWYSEVYPQIQQKYGSKIRLVYRNFPLYDKHPDAEAAAEAAKCAGDQNKYFEYHDLLFNGNNLGSTIYTAYAQQLKLNLDQFNQCVSSGQYQKAVKADFDYASNLGVQSTPTFFINGLAIVGAQPFSVFQQVIDLELAGKIPH